jgi:hypothetical protein
MNRFCPLEGSQGRESVPIAEGQPRLQRGIFLVLLRPGLSLLHHRLNAFSAMKVQSYKLEPVI